MNKIKFYLTYGVYSALIGGFTEVAALLLGKQSSITFYSMLKSMGIGVIIGTVSLFFLFQVFLKLTEKPVIGFLSNFCVVAALMLAGAILDGIHTYRQYINSRWFTVLIVVELLSFFLTYLWYRQIILYNKKLQLKRESLRDSP